MRERRILIVLILIMTILCVNIMPIVQDWWNKDAMVTAKAGVYEEMKQNLKVSVPGYSIYKDRTQTLGSAANPFIVLEIVPYEGYAEFGYLIEGCEPIDFEKVRYHYIDYGYADGAYYWNESPMNDTHANNVLSIVNSIIGASDEGNAFYWTKVSRFADDYDASHERVDQQVEWSGWFAKDWNGQGEFNVSGNVSGDDLEITYVGKGAGEYTFISYGTDMGQYFTSTKSAKLSYTRNGAAKQETIQVSTSSNEYQIYAKVMSPYEYEFHNAGYFLKTCLRVPEDQIRDYNIRVVTVTPEALNANLELIDAADYVSFNDATHVNNELETWIKFYRESEFSDSTVNQARYNLETYKNQSTRPNFSEHDLSWAATVKLLCKVSFHTEDFPGAPVTFPVTAINNITGEPYTKSISINRGFADCSCTTNITGGSGKINNIYKLYCMLIAPEDEETYGGFYDRYIVTGLVKEGTYNLNGKTVTTGYFPMLLDRYGNSDAAYYWNISTFVMVENFVHDCARGWYSELPSEIYSFSHLADASYGDRNYSVRNNIFTFNGDCSTTQMIVRQTFERKDDIYHSDPFTIEEFADRDTLSSAEVMYYLLHHRFKPKDPEVDPKPGDDPTPTPTPGDEPFELKMKINDSSKLRNFVNVDYDAQNVRSMLDSEKFDSKDGRLYGKVKIQVDVDTGRVIPDAELAFHVYVGEDGNIGDIYDVLKSCEKYQGLSDIDADIVKQDDYIRFNKAWNYSTGQWETVVLGGEYYIWLPLRVLHEQEVAGVAESDEEQTNSKEKWEFSCSVRYTVYENQAFTKKEISMDEHKSLTFVRRAMFHLD